MDTRILVTGVSVAGLAVGAVGGYLFAKKRYERAFAEALREAVDEEVVAVEQHYRILTKRGEEYSSPEAVLAARVAKTPVNHDGTPLADLDLKEPHTTEELEEILVKMKNWDPERAEGEKLVSDLKYWKGDDSRIIGQPKAPPMIPDRPKNEKKPYQISEAAYMQGEEGYDQEALAWYSGDDTLAGVDDDEMYEPNSTIGRELKLEEFGDEETLYFRNPETQTDFEVNLSQLSYRDFVGIGEESP